MNQNNVMRWRKRRTGGGRGGQMEVWTSPGGGVRVKRHGERDTKTNITFSVVLIYDLMHISIYIYITCLVKTTMHWWHSQTNNSEMHTKTHNNTNAQQHANSRDYLEYLSALLFSLP